jgi:Ca2+-binding EF-hand superfamily protein
MIKELRREFEKIYTDGSGEILLATLEQVLVSSLRAFTEEEVEDICNATLVRQSLARIH